MELPTNKIKNSGEDTPRSTLGKFPKHLKIKANNKFRELLRQVFVLKQKTNPRYSVRGLALWLKVDQSYLIKFLNSQRQFSIKSLSKMAQTMGLGPKQWAEIMDDPDHSSGFKKNSELESSYSHYTRIQDDQFNVIADGIHFAILEALKLKDIEPNEKALAQRLAQHSEVIRLACLRLERVGLLKRMGTQLQLQQKQIDWSDPATTTVARKNLQKQVTQLSLVAIDDIAVEERYHGSLTIAIDPTKMDQFKKRLEQIRAELAQEFQRPTDQLTQVYQLNLGFFPLTKKQNLKLNSKKKEKEQ